MQKDKGIPESKFPEYLEVKLSNISVYSIEIGLRFQKERTVVHAFEKFVEKRGIIALVVFRI
jgi:hypothetical protein